MKDSPFSRPSRRQFLFSTLGLGILSATSLAMTPSIHIVNDTDELAPGDIIRLAWPWSVDPEGATVVHVYNGQQSPAIPMPDPEGLLFPHVDIWAVPPKGRLRTGRHEFFLHHHSRWQYLGGFDIAPFRFGC